MQTDPQLVDDGAPEDDGSRTEREDTPSNGELIDGDPRESYSPAETHPEPDQIRIGGHDDYALDRASARERFEWRQVDFSTRCHSGTLIEGIWEGVSVADAMDAADPSPETTHVALVGVDGYTRCVPVLAVLDGIVGFDCVDGRDDGAPRVVASGLDSQASVMRLSAIEPVSLAPGEDPGEVEIALPAEEQSVPL
ncbi:Periplasmic DMSO/TMAO reductase YedYZ, molybdopterin-dependent catalytic subunit [Halalkaliarchaeum sp. AArc-CO]|uniref:hypothetical protein n=1 Tax=unclassified Halalkaliarchaeum TaxID=2678344 RepID=UPI00217E11E8|nr:MULTISPECIES: hypothetical protein [unclassified Halalkaliarchaeum]MDR5672543.1 hypothetical protein [Halalkaliarchaeum sp. AArc-GB]UWG50504.1 Periplasmic DMSO/TMAO reductase YedYZ, molybdopterin-dependent catalytic subunit [Halalkaliarchaeum sp. AArc-CO]